MESRRLDPGTHRKDAREGRLGVPETEAGVVCLQVKEGQGGLGVTGPEASRAVDTGCEAAAVSLE